MSATPYEQLGGDADVSVPAQQHHAYNNLCIANSRDLFGQFRTPHSRKIKTEDLTTKVVPASDLSPGDVGTLVSEHYTMIDKSSEGKPIKPEGALVI